MKGSPGDLAERVKEKRRKQRGGDKAKKETDNMTISDQKLIMRHSVFKGIVIHFGRVVQLEASWLSLA